MIALIVLFKFSAGQPSACDFFKTACSCENYKLNHTGYDIPLSHFKSLNDVNLILNAVSKEITLRIGQTTYSFTYKFKCDTASSFVSEGTREKYLEVKKKKISSFDKGAKKISPLPIFPPDSMLKNVHYKDAPDAILAYKKVLSNNCLFEVLYIQPKLYNYFVPRYMLTEGSFVYDPKSISSYKESLFKNFSDCDEMISKQVARIWIIDLKEFECPVIVGFFRYKSQWKNTDLGYSLEFWTGYTLKTN